MSKFHRAFAAQPGNCQVVEFPWNPDLLNMFQAFNLPLFALHIPLISNAVQYLMAHLRRLAREIVGERGPLPLPADHVCPSITIETIYTHEIDPFLDPRRLVTNSI